MIKQVISPNISAERELNDGQDPSLQEELIKYIALRGIVTISNGRYLEGENGWEAPGADQELGDTFHLWVDSLENKAIVISVQ